MAEMLIVPLEPAPVPTRPAVLSAAETAECTCPDACERDHDTD